ncbi:hypothetical protein EGW08_006605 [Elysia chlorotica]|uniref:Uncharacterized protein n=1 Tax=Elysia chlorotica TaxID=188477 RepID=A0A433TVU1_ELYCH|nr:hypothetical protein EGW08_006605 [Elysia chlorotica]
MIERKPWSCRESFSQTPQKGRIWILMECCQQEPPWNLSHHPSLQAPGKHFPFLIIPIPSSPWKTLSFSYYSHPFNPLENTFLFLLFPSLQAPRKHFPFLIIPIPSSP